MPKRMLINATQPEELRVALVDGQWLFDLDIESAGREQKKGNIYKARIIRFEPSLEALFVYYGSERHGFLPIREVSRELYAHTGIEELNRFNIKDFLPEGREILVQVDKEERGTKGAALTTFISLAGCYLVLMPNNPRAGGISRRVEGDDRAELREILSALNVPEGMGIIIRTAGVGRRLEDLQWDLGVLLTQWKAIQEAAHTRPAPFLIHQEGNVVTRAIRDYLRPDIDEVLVDDRNIYQDICHYIEMVRPDYIHRIKLYQDSIPLFNRYQIESQIESAFRRTVQLPSGGALVIDHTEALVSIDINSARATKGGDIEETALHTNLEAAEEVARQLRLRDIGGLIVIDFIDMLSVRNQRMVENRLREAVEKDRARIQVGRISRFGLLEMSRQRLRPVLGESSRIACPRCEGQGSIRGVDSQALIVLRVLEDEAIKDNTAEVLAELPVDVATYLMNEKRNALLNIENRHQVKIIIIPNPQLLSPHYHVNRLKMDDVASRITRPVSYSLISKTEHRPVESSTPTRSYSVEEPAVKRQLPTSPAPVTRSEAPGLIKRLWGSLFGAVEESEFERSSKTDNKVDNKIDSSRRPARREDGQRRQGQRQGHRDRHPREAAREVSESAPTGMRPEDGYDRNRGKRDGGRRRDNAFSRGRQQAQRKRKDEVPAQERFDRQHQSERAERQDQLERSERPDIKDRPYRDLQDRGAQDRQERQDLDRQGGQDRHRHEKQDRQDRQNRPPRQNNQPRQDRNESQDRYQSHGINEREEIHEDRKDNFSTDYSAQSIESRTQPSEYYVEKNISDEFQGKDLERRSDYSKPFEPTGSPSSQSSSHSEYESSREFSHGSSYRNGNKADNESSYFDSQDQLAEDPSYQDSTVSQEHDSSQEQTSSQDQPSEQSHQQQARNPQQEGRRHSGHRGRHFHGRRRSGHRFPRRGGPDRSDNSNNQMNTNSEEPLIVIHTPDDD